MNESGISSVREQGETMDADARSEAIAAVMQAMADDFYPLHRRAESVLGALTSPRSEKCNAPGCGVGGVDGEVRSFSDEYGWRSSRCEACSGSGRIEKGPIAYLSADLELEGWWCPWKQFVQANEGDDPEPPNEKYHALFRLPTPSHQSAEESTPCTHAWHEARVVKRADECPICHEQNHDGSRW